MGGGRGGHDWSAPASLAMALLGLGAACSDYGDADTNGGAGVGSSSSRTVSRGTNRAVTASKPRQ